MLISTHMLYLQNMSQCYFEFEQMYVIHIRKGFKSHTNYSPSLSTLYIEQKDMVEYNDGFILPKW